MRPSAGWPGSACWPSPALRSRRNSSLHCARRARWWRRRGRSLITIPYSARDLDALLQQAEALDARLVTTPKDAVRLPPAFRAGVTVVGVGLEWEDRAGIEALLDAALAG